jgi:K+-sensing histidine kinase KdpD
MQRSLGQRLRPYAVAFLGVLVATILRLLKDRWLDQSQIFSWYYVAVAVAALCGGWRCAIATSILGFLAADWFFIEPRQSLMIWSSGIEHWLGLLTYVGVSLAIAGCIEAIRRQAPALVLRLDLDDSLELLDVASAVRMHGICSKDLLAYLEGLNASQKVVRLAAHLAAKELSSRELAWELESFVKAPARLASG